MKELSTTLKKIGLTESEIKVYIALLKLGPSSKTKLLAESKIASSKLYEVTNKLIEKGLCSIITKDGVKYFSAANPLKIKDYLRQKKEELTLEENSLEKILPLLGKIRESSSKEIKVETFVGWKGMETVYSEFISQAKKGQEVFIIGAGSTSNEEKLEIFFTKYGRMALQKGLRIKVLFNENAREYVKKIEKNLGISHNKRFLFNSTPTEITVSGSRTAILIRRTEPIIILINDLETSTSFKNYFLGLWKIARK